MQWYNPATWDVAFGWVWLGFFVIIFFRAGGTYLIGRAMRISADHTARTAKILASPAYRRAEKAIDDWGAPIVAASFLTIGFQTAVNFAAGMIRMQWFRYLPALIIGGSLWAAVYGSIGLVSVKAIGMAYQRWPAITLTVTISLTLMLILWLILKLYGKSKAKPES